MRGINKVIIVGAMGADPEVRYTGSGAAVASLRVATSETWTDKATGQPTERTEWHSVTIWGKLAEIAGKYLRKGSKVYLEGKLQTEKWQDKQTGEDRYTTKIVADTMQMLGDSRNGPAAPEDEAQAAPRGRNSYADAKSGKAPMPPADFDDDIPF